ncbi:MAG: hypothetical protein ACTSP3_01430 [Candidatus Heimdallarchaeaceae archaeon]
MIPEDVKEEIHNLFFCKECKTHLQFYMNMGDEPEIIMDCPGCDKSDIKLDFLESEDVSYVSKPYILKSSHLLVRNEENE